jgi:proteic killer suppression protein
MRAAGHPAPGMLLRNQEVWPSSTWPRGGAAICSPSSRATSGEPHPDFTRYQCSVSARSPPGPRQQSLSPLQRSAYGIHPRNYARPGPTIPSGRRGSAWSPPRVRGRTPARRCRRGRGASPFPPAQEPAHQPRAQVDPWDQRQRLTSSATGPIPHARQRRRAPHAPQRRPRFEDLRVPPGNRLEALKGDRRGQHSIRVNDKWRLCFRWADGNAYEVEIVDYH